ncbi:hypothetical protein TrST_g1670 [Triparma strigata]|uniref:Uncharacterized protein n=1 Tax=Triparma strigata TaxID=1606541 RepID=A0A9W7BEJ3_9STRA|nr:hypothetical protein TrST_g1670 [Triparma strigata]
MSADLETRFVEGGGKVKGEWEGECYFGHNNLFGSFENLGIKSKRNPTDPIPSFRLNYGDSKLGNPGGYEVDVFSDYIGGGGEEENIKKLNEWPKMPSIAGVLGGFKRKSNEVESVYDATDTTTDTATETETTEATTDREIITKPGNPGDAFARRGVSYTLKKPFSKICHNSEVTSSVEQTSTNAGDKEYLASVNVELGPVVSNLPGGLGRHSLVTRVDVGGRLSEEKTVTPYTSTTVINKDIIPLTSSTLKDPVVIASKTGMVVCGEGMPGWEMKRKGGECRIRGYRGLGEVSQAVSGTLELRIPTNIQKKVLKNSSVLFFVDGCLTRPGKAPEEKEAKLFEKKYCAGVGARVGIMGIPLKVDLGLNKEGEVVRSVALGGDFQI